MNDFMKGFHAGVLSSEIHAVEIDLMDHGHADQTCHILSHEAA